MTKPRAYCRACLSIDVKLHDITETLMAKAFETATGIPASYNTGSQRYLCTYCCKRTQNCVVFRRQCLAAQQKMTALCSDGEQLTQELIKSSDVKDVYQSLTRSVTECVNYTPSKSRESSPPICAIEIKVEYPLSNDPLSNVAVTYDPSEEEVNCEMAKENDFVNPEQQPQPKPETTKEPEPTKPKQRRKVTKPRKVNKSTTPPEGATLDLSVNKEPTVKKKPYQCDVCGKFFTSGRILTRHRRIHTGEKPYKCQECGKAFSVNIHLKVHMRVHTGEKPFKCDVCSKSFSQRTHIKAHRRTHTGEKPYKCETCQKSFSYSTHLVTHRRIHTGEKPYNCDICAKSFKTQGSLISHKRAHTGEKPYKCEACGKCFSNSSSFVRHKRSHCAVRRI